MKTKRTIRFSNANRNALNGYLFLLPWILGFLTFFFLPMLQSIWYSFSASGPLDEINGHYISYFKEMFSGLKNYKYTWFEDATYTNNFVDSIGQFLYSLPIIIILSLISAIVLNQKFRGRMIARAVFFLPVIIASGVVMVYLNGDVNAQQLMQAGQGNDGMYTSFSFATMLNDLGLPETITQRLTSYINSIFTLIWSSGVQTILFLSGLQSVSEQYYEVARVEGGTSWETFWFVTFPMLTNVTILNVIYTCIDLFTDSSNKVMKQAYELIEKAEYNNSAAMMWSLFVVLGAFLALVFVIFRKQINQNSFS